MTPPRGTARIAASVVLASAGVFLALCLLTYAPQDVSFLSHPPRRPVGNLGGTLGVWLGWVGRGGFGWASFMLPLLGLVWAWRVWRGAAPELHGLSFTVATVGLLSSGGTLLALAGPTPVLQGDLGGIVGFLLADRGRYYLGTVGTVLTASCVGLLSWLVVSGQTLRTTGFSVLRRLGGLVASGIRRPATAGASVEPVAAALPRPRVREGLGREAASDEAPDDGPAEPPDRSLLPPVRIRSTVVAPKLKTIPTPPKRSTPSGFQLPPLDLLATPPPMSERQVTEDLQVNARILEETLREFGVEATVVNIDRGPAVTRYELTPAPGVKLTKIVSLADDLALVLKAASCHVVAPIPGRGRVGVDVPNTTTTMVYLKEILTAHEFAGTPSPLVLPIGKDVSGHAIVTDLRECPHLLIAGATGSGKTVCLNSLLTGILTHASPEQVRFLMIDPKMVELSLFNEIPHLSAPVVTHAKKASVALHWAVEEMERRYQLLAEAGVRNIDLYNKRLASRGAAPAPAAPAAVDGAPEAPAEAEGPLPYLVIVIDELADLMMVASQDVESAITRLAQLSRAVGIHIILATQRPSVDVITGVIKANFPARIAFQVASKVDSRTILDMNGADKLLGRGDLMFLRPGTAKPIRAQGAFVTDGEIERITAFLKQQRPPAYDERLAERARTPEGALITEKDELYDMAKRIVLESGQASTSLLQRRLRLGYGRAARILDLMEQEGVVGPPQGSRPREILVSREPSEQGESTA
ncbi:MAG: DNA translocase FtsK 4TM domain-containing protein [Candidatus Omnitrophica bacterium]|nr:DNA translocase FtsK 4TM domain-containing protein [Candidatus Omnitrophota bacterium]